MCDSDPPTVYSETTRTARKAHRCCEHHHDRTIRPGDRYVAIKGLWDGAWSNYRRCMRCHRVCAAMHLDALEHGDDCGIVFGDMRAELRQRVYDRHRWAKVWAKGLSA